MTTGRKTKHGTAGHEVRVRRVYEAPEPGDGIRVLVDRLWPRGLAKSEAALDEWLKDAAPTAELRKWYGHDPERFGEFAGRYAAELAGPGPERALARLRELAAEDTLTLLTATKDTRYSHALLLAAEVRGGAH
ncbi:putative uroporphyrin-III c-methyltransferase [Streptomyces sp. L-9-10]|uniref:DUF488 domain-containing protein n=1 Tax=Streptomyces sp. L-9-10 TaxID=1478131 RepID=UPI00101D035F|nr:DUF488 family protein [Streptomyces sp. L-9-10]RYJ20820.1 putative uroporphyrin-III c-methyltransferase [Streptomyces sp. L-9-10]